jgi:hypothetical protein
MSTSMYPGMRPPRLCFRAVPMKTIAFGRSPNHPSQLLRMSSFSFSLAISHRSSGTSAYNGCVGEMSKIRPLCAQSPSVLVTPCNTTFTHGSKKGHNLLAWCPGVAIRLEFYQVLFLLSKVKDSLHIPGQSSRANWPSCSVDKRRNNDVFIRFHLYDSLLGFVKRRNPFTPPFSSLQR